MGELELIDAPAFKLELLVTSDVGLSFKGRPTLLEWAAVGEALGKMTRWSPWAIGDWFNEGEKRFGEEWSQYVGEDASESVVGVSGRRVRSYAKVCREIPEQRRFRDLEFGHHALVVRQAQGWTARYDWLQLAADARWTIAELRAAIKSGGDVTPDLELALGKLERAVEWAYGHLGIDDLQTFQKRLVQLGWTGGTPSS